MMYNWLSDSYLPLSALAKSRIECIGFKIEQLEGLIEAFPEGYVKELYMVPLLERLQVVLLNITKMKNKVVT